MELEEYIRRAPAMLEDESVKPGDPRFETLEKKNVEYITRLQEENEKVRKEHLDDLQSISREKLEAKFMEGWRLRRTMEEWSAARRTTELWLSARKCQATKELETLAGEVHWDHGKCDHTVKFFSERFSLAVSCASIA